MRAVVQRARDASVRVDGVVVGGFAGDGLVVLVGVTHADSPSTAERLAAKVHDLRIMGGERSAAELGSPVLVVSQFTLYGDTAKGRRPSWSAAAPGETAQPLVDLVVATLRARGATVAEGVFGASMEVSLTNVGPMTLVVDVT